MSQEPKLGPPPIGVIYSTSMARPDAALALAALYVSASRRESRMGAVCVSGAGLDTAIFCDIVGRFYTGQGRAPSSNAVLPVGLTVASPMAADPPMVLPAVRRMRPTGEPQYARSVQKVTDTALADAVLRNGVTFNTETVVVLSAPASPLARSLTLAGAAAQFKQRVRRLLIVEAGAAGQDPAPLRRVVIEAPAPVIFCGREIGEALRFPGAELEKDFGWAPANPVADAYRAFRTMPYDAALDDLAAAHYALHPASGFFTLSDSGTLSVGDDGRLTFAAGTGTAHRLILDGSRTAECVAALVALATSKPAPPPQRGSG